MAHHFQVKVITETVALSSCFGTISLKWNTLSKSMDEKEWTDTQNTDKSQNNYAEFKKPEP